MQSGRDKDGKKKKQSLDYKGCTYNTSPIDLLLIKYIIRKTLKVFLLPISSRETVFKRQTKGFYLASILEDLEASLTVSNIARTVGAF